MSVVIAGQPRLHLLTNYVRGTARPWFHSELRSVVPLFSMSGDCTEVPSLGILWLWVGFNGFVLALLALDLGVFHRKAHAVSVKEAGLWSVAWISLALLFDAGLYIWAGSGPALEFLTGYLIEKSLSVDNIFVFVLIFTYFNMPARYQHRVLFWGVLGALVMRAAMIVAGAALLERFHWIIYAFGGFLLVTGIKMAFQKRAAVDLGANLVVRLFKRLVPVTEEYADDRFIIRKNGVRFATPLLLVLVLVEASDLLFATDSIPAIFAVTRDPFLVYTSNVFAILGLRSLYFLLAGVVTMFRYLKLGLAVVLSFVGVKMLVTEVYKLPTALSLGVILGILTVSILASVLIPEAKAERREGSVHG
jgi:tellurite resistance protein TerC